MTCPFLELADGRCAARLSLTNLNQAFQYCVGRYHACPLYDVLLSERLQRRRPMPAVSVTAAPALKAG